MSANIVEATRKGSLTALQRASMRWHDASMNDDVMAAFAVYQHSQNLAANTLRNREALLRTASRRLGKPLLELTVQDLRIYMGRPDMGANTKRTIRNAFRTFYNFCVEDGWLDESPAEKLPVVRVPKGEPRPFTREQIDAMLNSGALRKTRAMILVGYYQGFRVSQIARVRGDDIDQLTQTIGTVAKGGKVRRLPLHPVIRELAETMPAGWWFPARDGSDKPVSGASVTNLITRAKKRAGITDTNLTGHSLRHSFGTELVRGGANIRAVQELMRHSSLQTTQRYTQVLDEDRREALAVLPVRALPAKSGRKAA